MMGIVSTAELAERLETPGLRLLDLRGSFAPYLLGHIPGAEFLHIETLRMSQHGVPCKMHALPVLGSIFGRLGITVDTPVVIYATRPIDHLSATYAAWTLAVTGNTQALLLDGGFQKWADEGRSVIRAYPKVGETTYAAHFDPAQFADLEYVRTRLDDPGVVLVDSRTRSMYNGATGPTPRLGHLPGAILHNYIWDFQRDGTYQPPEMLRARCERQGITPDKEIITYCVTGREGSAVWFMLKALLGYPRVRLYQASLAEWAACPELPLVMGDAPGGRLAA